MKRIIPGFLIIILSGLILFLLSCAPESCFDVTESFVKASFYNVAAKKLQAPDSLTMYGTTMDTNKLYNKAGSVQPALIPLNADTSVCTYIIRINGITDTLQFKYNSYPHLVSKECGYTYFFNLLDTPAFTKNAIINIYMSNSNISIVNEENIRIFY